MIKKRTKIVCTLGPATESESIMRDMIKAGMNVARLNFSHGTYDNHRLLIERIRRVSADLEEPVPVMQDLQGPKIRVGVLPDSGVVLEAGNTAVFDTGIDTYTEGGAIPVDYKELHTHVQSGERLLLNDGRVETVIEKVEGTAITVNIKNSGTITSHKGLNIPDSHLSVSALTDKDKADARFGVEIGVDMMALSFVTSGKDILDLRFLIAQYEKELGISQGEPIRIVAKVERALALPNLNEIIEAADAIMVARGDLGIELPGAEVPIVQKRLIDACIAAAKPVIVATQMLDSMQDSPRPTRAEVSDVANAVIDHTDAVMLSNETATGKYPVETVATMADIIRETEHSVYDDMAAKPLGKNHHAIDDVMTQLSRLLAEDVQATLVLAASLSGDTARLISRNRPELPIAVGTASERVLRQLNLSWGVVPFLLEPCATIEELVSRSVIYLKRKKLVKSGDRIVVVAGEPVGHSGHVNVLEVREVV